MQPKLKFGNKKIFTIAYTPSAGNEIGFGMFISQLCLNANWPSVFRYVKGVGQANQCDVIFFTTP